MCWVTPMTRRRKRRGFMWPYIMNKLLRFGTLLVCLGFAAPLLAQTYDDQPVPADSTDSTNCRAVVGQAEIDGTMQQGAFVAQRVVVEKDGVVPPM